MPKDVMVTTDVGTINLVGDAFAEYKDSIMNKYGVNVVSRGDLAPEQTEVYLYGRKADVEAYLREVYGCAEGEEDTFFESEFTGEIIFFNFTNIDRYLQDTGWIATSQEGLEDGKKLITRFYDKPASDGTNVRFYFPAAEEGSAIEFSVILYQDLMSDPLDGKSFTKETISAGIDYAESLVSKKPLSGPAQEWLNRGGHKLNMRPEFDY